MKKILIGIVWLVALALTIYSLIYREQLFINGTLIIGWLLFAIQITMNNFEKVYLHTKRIWFKISNPECIWNFQVTYTGEFHIDIFDKLDDLFISFDANTKITELSHIRRNYRIGTIVLEVKLDENTEYLRFIIQDIEVSYRRSNYFIEDKISKLFEKIQYLIKPEKGAYGLLIKFNEYNPYYGFFIRRLKTNDIQGFHITFNVDEDRVKVNQNQIEINTETLQHMRELSKQYLVLSPAS